MSNSGRREVKAFLFLLVFLLLVSPSLAQKRIVRIGTVMDGPSTVTDRDMETYRNEISTILEDEYNVEFPAQFQLKGNWTVSSVQESLDSLFAADEVDFVLTTGVISSVMAARRDELSKPVFAPYVPSPEVWGIPEVVRQPDPSDPYGESQKVSGKKNLNYLELGLQLDSDLERLRELTPVSRLAVLVMKPFAELYGRFSQRLGQELGTDNPDLYRPILATRSAEETLAAIPADADAVLVTPLLFWTSADYEKLLQGLIQRKLPSFSSAGQSLVEQGALAGQMVDDEVTRRARRIGINMQEVLGGKPISETPVDFSLDRHLVINMATARAIGVSPRFTTLIEADVLNEQRTQPARTISLPSVVREASMTNLDLAAADRSVEAGEETVRDAKSVLLPQIGISGGGAYTDPDYAQQIPGLGETQWRFSVGGSQLIYSDKAWAGYHIEQSLQDAREDARAQLRLDVIFEAAEAYLILLNAKTVERIQKDNLALTRSNLELAESRVEIGIAGREELFRWESQIAQNQRSVVEAEALRRQAELSVNRVLNKPLVERFGTIEADLNDPELVSSFEALAPYIDSPGGFWLYSDFMVEQAFAAAPEIARLEAELRAKDREVAAESRSFYIPDISFQGSFTGFDNHGRGSEPFFPGMEELHKFWEVSVDARLPLFEGGGRSARVARAKFEYEELSLQQEAIRQRVEQRMRSSLFGINSSFLGIGLAKASAEAAQRNLDLISSSYAEGVVGILALLDAQNQALVAELTAAGATFKYLLDFMGGQRAAGRFDYYRTPQERQEFLSRLAQFYQSKGFTIRKP
ncbi:MAG TPA: TolC family protein [Acidobacteriota bacterium]|nr:TolC family protein [Acidobacteriota bacterium]